MKHNNYITPSTEVTELMQTSTLCAGSKGAGAQVGGGGIPGGNNDGIDDDEVPVCGRVHLPYAARPIRIRR